MTESPLRVGERVSWLGGLDFGSRTVRWVGTVVKVGLGVPYYFDPPRYSDDGYSLEAGRDPAVEVMPDYPQHGVKERLVHRAQTVIRAVDVQRLAGRRLLR